MEGIAANSGRGPVEVLVVNTKKRCLMCRRQRNNNQVSENNWEGSSLPLKMLARHLEININEVARKSATSSVVTPPPPPLLENRQVGVGLCEGCSSRMDRFGKLYNQLQVIKMRVDGVVREIEEQITASMNEDEDEDGGGGKSFEAHFAKNLRDEVLEKCLVSSVMTYPRVKLVGVTEKVPGVATEQEAAGNKDCEDTSKTFGDLLLEMGTEQFNGTNFNLSEEGILQRVDIMQEAHQFSNNNDSITPANALNLENVKVEKQETEEYVLLDPGSPGSFATSSTPGTPGSLNDEQILDDSSEVQKSTEATAAAGGNSKKLDQSAQQQKAERGASRRIENCKDNSREGATNDDTISSKGGPIDHVNGKRMRKQAQVVREKSTQQGNTNQANQEGKGEASKTQPAVSHPLPVRNVSLAKADQKVRRRKRTRRN